MVSIRVLLGMLSLLGFASVSSAQTFACGGAGYNLASIGDLSVITNGWYWTLNPCRPLTSGPCANTNATACQNGYNATTLQPNSGGAVLNYYNPFVNVVTWTTINGGIMSRAINGGQDSCSLGTSIRTVAVEYLCNATATTAFISGFEEVNQCQYLAQVQTSLVCTAAALGASTAVGLPFNSNTCGGGLFDLSSLDVRDFTFNGGNGNVLTFRPCSPINTTTSGSCPAGTSFCQSNGNGLSAGNGLAQTYTLQADGVIIQSQDGATCGQGSSNWGWPREANVYLKCNPAATTPIYVNNSFFEGETNSNYPGENPNGATEPAGTEYCHYSVIIQTAAVCTRLAASTSTAVAIPAPLFSCGGAGYDLTLIAAVDMDYQRPSPYLDTFFVNPCRPLTQGPCAGQGASVCTGNLTGGGGYTSNVLAYLQPTYAPIQWSNTTYNGAQAVQSYSQYGDQGCSASANTRSATVVYYCATPAGGALSKITSVVQVDGCSYTIYVATTVVCGTPLNASTAVGYPFNSNTCGGGLFNLSALDSTDFQFNTSSTQAYWWRPCSAATSFVCSAANATFCQYGGSSSVYALAVPAGYTQFSSAPNNVSAVLNVTAVTTYTLQSNGLLIQSQDGTYCGSIPRAAATFLVCSPSALTPSLLSYTENSGTSGYLNNGQAYCHYELVIATRQACTAAQLAPVSSSSSSSSSGAASGRGSSSGGSSSTGSVVVTVGSSSGTVASRPSSSSSSSSTGSQVPPISFATSSSSSSSFPSSSSSSSSSSTGAPASLGGSSSSSSTAAVAPITVASGASASSAVSAMLVAVVMAMMALLL